MKLKKKQLTPLQMITCAFAALVLAGTLLLSLPAAARSGEAVPFADALFTATSASCVTGLVVYDTYTHWSMFGQIVILLLIQIGGIGIITLSMYFLSMVHAKIGMRHRLAMQESIGVSSTRGVVRMTRFIAAGVLLIEGIGAVLLAFSFIPEFGFAKGCYFAVFHSVSAFCNAGFDLMGEEAPFASLSGYAGNPYVCTITMLLIIVGGLGFFVWRDLKKNGFRFKRYALHTKVVVVTSSILILGGALFFFLLSYDSAAQADRSVGERALISLFQSVSARTAGFSTVDLAEIGGGAQMLMICLMLVGGSPGSTAGGIKTTTVAVLFLLVRSIFRRKEDVECFGRRVDRPVIRTAIAVFVLYLFLALAAGIAVSALEDIDILAALFETVSAMATVGLSLSVTPELGSISKIIVTVLMFLGRVGGLTVLLSLSRSRQTPAGRCPVENIAVG